MKKILILSVFILMSCASKQEKNKSDPLIDLLVTMGAIDDINIKAEKGFQSLKDSDPKNSKYYECIKSEYSEKKIVDNLRPYYYKIFTDDEMVSLNNFLKTPLGSKFLLLSKNPSMYNRSSFTEAEKLQLNSYISEHKFFNKDDNIVLINASNEVGKKMIKDAMEKCSGFKSYWSF